MIITSLSINACITFTPTPTQERTVDLAAESRTDAKQWKSALTALLNKLAQPEHAQLDEDHGYIPEMTPAPPPLPSSRSLPPQPLSQRQSIQAPPPPPPPSPAQAKLMLFDAVERIDTKAMTRILDATNTPIDIMDDVTGNIY